MDPKCRYSPLVGDEEVSTLKNPKVLLLILCWIASVLLIAPWPKSGMVVEEVGENSSLYQKLFPGDIVFSINKIPIEEVDLTQFEGKFVSIETSRGKIDLFLNRSDIKLRKRDFTNLKFGLDLQGGIYAVVEPECNATAEILNEIKLILEKRTSSLREAMFQVSRFGDRSFIQIQIAGGTESELKQLLNTTGVFEGKIPLHVSFEEGRGVLKIGAESEWVDVTYCNGKVCLLGEEIEINETLTYKGIELQLVNLTESRADFLAVIYRNAGERRDIVRVYIDPERSWLRKEGAYYSWGFQVEITPEAAQRFYDVVRNLAVRSTGIGGEAYLEERLYLYLDGKEVSNLSISAGLKEKPVTVASVTGSALTREEAMRERSFLQNILRSGSLPCSIKIVSMKNITPKLGTTFLQNLVMAGIIALVVITFVLLARYRNLKVVMLSAFTSISEIVFILAGSVLLNWTLDLGALIGILMVIGSGVTQEVMIIDEIIHGEVEKTSLRERISRAFSIILGSAGTVIGAMFPLLIFGFGLLRGFAITTILGVLIGVGITRSAFSHLVRKIYE